MAYIDLLPTAEDFSRQLEDLGLDENTRRDVLFQLSTFLREHGEYHKVQYRISGEKADLGSSGALDELAKDFLAVK